MIGVRYVTIALLAGAALYARGASARSEAAPVRAGHLHHRLSGVRNAVAPHVVHSRVQSMVSDACDLIAVLCGMQLCVDRPRLFCRLRALLCSRRAAIGIGISLLVMRTKCDDTDCCSCVYVFIHVYFVFCLSSCSLLASCVSMRDVLPCVRGSDRPFLEAFVTTIGDKGCCD